MAQNNLGRCYQYGFGVTQDYLEAAKWYRLAADKGIGQQIVRLCEQLAACLDYFFDDYQPQPSLLHGDLWGGNAAYDDHGEPVIFDPACYYGDREADLAMTELFSGFGKAFYAGYNEAWPLDPGYRTRKGLYNHYHILNHYNLFGGSYGIQAFIKENKSALKNFWGINIDNVGGKGVGVCYTSSDRNGGGGRSRFVSCYLQVVYV